MRRLTYAPKAYVFVRSRNHQNKIYDVSDFVVSGTVDRKVNDVSTATVVLRNSFFQFSPERKDSFFLPMDGITIWLQRIKNKPIQVFTGYLDSVPYYQMYPGDCQITASCTLKRLEYTYFDPSIYSTTQFFLSFGWAPEGDGTYTNRSGKIPTSDDRFAQNNHNVGLNNKTKDGQFNPLTDSGMGAILKPFMSEIAGWDPNQVHVADLPRDLPAKAAKLYNKLNAENLSMLDGLQTLLQGFMSISVDPNATSAATAAYAVVNTIAEAAGRKNVDPTTMALAALALSGLDPTFIGPNGELGLYACPNKNADKTQEQNSNANPGLGMYNTGDFFSNPSYDTKSANYDSKTGDQIVDPATATEAFAIRMIKADPKKAFAKSVGKDGGNLLAMIEWIAAAAGVPQAKIEDACTNSFDSAKRLIATFTGAAVGANDPMLKGASANQLPLGLTWSDSGKMFSSDTYNDKPIFDSSYNNANDSLAPYAYVAHKTGLVLVRPPKQIGKRNDIIVLQSPSTKQEQSNQIKQFFDWAKTQTAATVVRYEPPQPKTPTKSVVFDKTGKAAVLDVEYHNGLAVSSAAQQTDWPAGYVYIQVPKNAPYPQWTGNPDTSTAQSNAVPGGSPTTPNSTGQGKPVTFEDVVRAGLGSAFFAQADFPGDVALSNTLRGDKALMNDIPVMEAVKQFCGGSMRSFMSLPDGSFCAFYPDYFGASNRKFYWAITDLEIIDMGIQLSDQALATHVYVTGSTTNPGSGTIQGIKDAVSTLGVVTLQHVFGDGNFISGDIKGNKSGDIVGREMEAYQFMKFYGARPYAIQQPLIRNAVFEFLYAWQMFMFLWAKQFQTRCEFTFQPEIMAGGRIAFPDHGLEMYVDSVRHSFSYEQGFTTSAVLMAPTTTVKDPDNPNYMPGMALAGQLTTVGT